MQSSAIQFVINMEIERDKKAAGKKTVLHLVLLVGLPVCKPAYVYLHVDACRARMRMRIRTFSPLSVLPRQVRAVHSKHPGSKDGSISMPKAATSISCSINHATCKAGTYIHTCIHMYIHMYVHMYVCSTYLRYSYVGRHQYGCFSRADFYRAVGPTSRKSKAKGESSGHSFSPCRVC